MKMGAESFSGGTITTSIVEVVSPSREQLGQWNKWLIVSRSTSVDRVHRMSTWQAGQTGGSSSLKCSFDFVHHAWSRRLLLRSTYRTVWTFATVQMWTPKGQPRIFPSGCWLVLPEIADNRRTGIVLKIEKPRNYGAFYGGRTRDRTLDLSRVKGTLSR